MPTDCSPPRPECIGWCASRLLTRTRGGTLRLLRCLSIPRSTKTSKSKLTKKTCGWTLTERRARAGSTSTPRTRRCESPTCRLISWSPVKTSARSTRTAPWPCRSCVPGFTSLSWKSGAPRPKNSKPISRTSASARRFATMSSRLTVW